MRQLPLNPAKQFEHWPRPCVNDAIIKTPAEYQRHFLLTFSTMLDVSCFVVEFAEIFDISQNHHKSDSHTEERTIFKIASFSDWSLGIGHSFNSLCLV